MIKANARLAPGLRKTVACLLLAPVICAADVVHAGQACESLQALVRQAHSNFIDTKADPGIAVSESGLPNAGTCRLAQSASGPKVYFCSWKFGFREADATKAFEALDGLVRRCFASTAVAMQDLGVNHPDSYELRQYELEGVRVAVATKDKSASQRTYLFLRITGRLSD